MTDTTKGQAGSLLLVEAARRRAEDALVGERAARQAAEARLVEAETRLHRIAAALDRPGDQREAVAAILATP
jgi:hypothetical protein